MCREGMEKGGKHQSSLDVAAPSFTPANQRWSDSQKGAIRHHNSSRDRDMSSRDRRREKRGSAGGSSLMQAAKAGGDDGNRGEQRRRQGQGRRGNANHLLNFQFQPPQPQDFRSPSPPGRGRRGETGLQRTSGGFRGYARREQFLQANFHFLLQPDADRRHESFYDPDVLVDWGAVEAVRVPRLLPRKGPTARPVAATAAAAAASVSSEHAEDVLASASAIASLAVPIPTGEEHEKGEDEDDRNWRCPICLEAPRCPRITKCGHVFCAWCILRHVSDGGGTGGARRCPMCSETVSREALRGVDRRAVRALAPGAAATLLLFRRHKTSLVPEVAGAEQQASDTARTDARAGGDSNGGRKGGKSGGSRGGGGSGGNDDDGAFAACPWEDDAVSDFSRLVLARPQLLVARLEAEAVGLAAFRAECLEGGDTEWLPFVAQAAETVEARREVLRAQGYAAPKPRPRVLGGSGRRGSGRRGSDTEEEEGGVFVMTLDDNVGLGDAFAADGASGMTRTSNATSGGEEAAEHEEHHVDDGDEEQQRKQFQQNDAAAADCNSGGDGESGADGSDCSGSPRTPLPKQAGRGDAGGAASAVAPPQPPPGLYSFFQAEDGGPFFIHPLSMKCLLEEAGQDVFALPASITAKVLEIETVKLTRELRRRLPFLAHLPEFSDVSFVELDLRGQLSDETLAKFKPEMQRRQRKRRNRAREEQQERNMEARAAAERAEKLAILRTVGVDLSGPLPSGGAAAPVFPFAGSEEGNINGGGSGGSGDGSTTVALEEAAAVAAASRSPGDAWSFARVTSMGGHFPSLGGGSSAGGGGAATATSAAIGTTPPPAAGIWARTPSLVSSPGSSLSAPAALAMATPMNDAWPQSAGGGRRPSGSGGSWAASAQRMSPPLPPPSAAAMAAAASALPEASPAMAAVAGAPTVAASPAAAPGEGKKSKKGGKGVALFSNSSARDMRR